MTGFINSNVNFALENIKIQYVSGKTIDFISFKDYITEKTDNGKVVKAEIPGYKAELTVNEIQENILGIKAKFICGEDVSDRIYKVYTLSLSSSYDKNTQILVNHRFQEGVTSIVNIPDDCMCKDFTSFYHASNPDNAVTIVSKLPAKFKSDIEIFKDDECFNVLCSTTIPYTYEGDIDCQEWMVSFNMSTDCALKKCASMFASKKEFENPIGWSTWDYYFTSATEDDVKQNVDYIAADKTLSKKVRYIALDDGWQQREGDWLSGCRYPSGLKSLVDYIKEKGFEAGIWVAPTRLHFLCGTVMRRNEFLVRDEYGDPVKDEDMYILDPTHPDGEKFIRETFTYLAKCGFTFYKLDFISNIVYKSERFYDKNAGPFDVLKRLVQIVRETVPEGSHIMGCSIPYGIGADVADTRRTGLDIHNVWGHLKTCTAQYISQFASSGVIYRCDLDYLLVRGKDTSDDKMTNVINDKLGYRKANPTDRFVWRGGEDFNYIEAKTWCTVLLMSGSSIFMGDCLPRLNEKGLELIRTTVSEADFKAATPVLDCEKIPAVWYKKELNKLYIFNFTDDNKDYKINLKSLGLSSGTYIDMFSSEEYTTDDVFNVSLNPHASLALKLK